MAKIYIYALHCPKTDEIRYIGKSKRPKQRLKQHIDGEKKYPVSNWAFSLAKEGLCPKMTIISEVEESEWEAEEIRQIKLNKDMGCKLLNIALGGNHIPITKEQQSKNGKKTKETLYLNPEKKKIWEIKRRAGQLLRDAKKMGNIEGANRLIDSMRYAAYKKPHLFSKWATLQFIE